MHELSVTQSLLALALERAEAAQAQRVCGITVQIGALSGIVADSIRFYFDALTPGTLAAGAWLAVDEVAGRVRCRGCGREYEPMAAGWLCPACGAVGGSVLAGRECLLRAVEIETGSDDDGHESRAG